MLVVVGTILISALRWSVMATMQLNPPSSGSGPTKSMATQSSRFSGTGKGCREPIGEEVADLFRWQDSQEEIYMVSISLHMFGQ